MEKETKNKSIFEDSILNLIFQAGPKRLKGVYWKAVLAKVLYFLPFFVLAILPIILFGQVKQLWVVTLLIAFLLIGPMQHGYVRFFNKLTKGENPSVVSIFCWKDEKFLQALVIGTVMSTAYLLGTILLVIPALIFIAMFSMVMFCLDKFEYDNVGEALIDCKVRMTGKGVSMLFYKLFFWVMFGLLLVGGIVLASLIHSGVVASAYTITIVVGGSLISLFFFALISAWYHACNQVYFEETLVYAEKNAKRREQQIKFEESLKGKAKVEEIKVEDIKVKDPVKKTTVNKPKTTATKTTTAKPKTTTAGTKTATAKPKTTTSAAKKSAPKPKTTTKK